MAPCGWAWRRAARKAPDASRRVARMAPGGPQGADAGRRMDVRAAGWTRKAPGNGHAPYTPSMGDLAGTLGSALGHLVGNAISLVLGTFNDLLASLQGLVPEMYRLPVVLVIIAAILALLLVRR